MKNMYTKLLMTALILTSSAAFAQSDLILTGAIDGPLAGGTPKAVEIYVVNDVADLSIYGIANANNGDASAGAPVFTFPADAATAGDYIYVSSVAPEFATYFGFEADYVANSALSVNGDDVIELYQNGTVVDYMGAIGVDGSGEAWEYKDGWMYRNNGTGPNTTFTLSEWAFSGVDANDGYATNAEAANPWPIGTFSTEGGGGGVPVPATIVEIQETTDEAGDSPLNTQLVVTDGIVTAVESEDGFWIQDGVGAWTGIFIEQASPTVAQGDAVTVIGTVEEHYGLTQLTAVTDVTVNSSGNALPGATALTTGTAGVEEYESVLISVAGVTCLDNDLGFGEWLINDGSGDYIADDVFYDASPVTFMGYDLTGISTYSFNAWKLAPRDAADVIADAGADVLGLSFENSEISVDEISGTVMVNVTITNPTTTATTVDVVVSGGDAVNGTNYTFTDPTTLTFPANSTDTQSFSFEVLDDTEANADRTISFALQNATNAATVGIGTLEVTIADDDAEVVITDIAIVAAVDADGVAINNGTEFTIAGIVYGVNMNAAGLSFTVNDQTGGIGFYSGTPVDGYVVTEGDSVVITGVVNQFNGLTQMTPASIELISQGNALAEPTVITELNENYESHLVTLECVYLADPSQWSNEGSGFNVTVTNGTTEYAVRIDNDVDLYSAEAPTGTFNVTGIVGQYDSESPYLEGYQLFPRYSADIEAAECGIEQPPVNDNCNSAIDVSSLVGGAIGEMMTSATYTNVNATAEGDPTAGWDCFGEATPSLESTVWFTFVGDGNTYYITTTNCDGTATNYIPDGDTQIAIYSGLCAIPTAEACNEDNPDATEGAYEAGLDFETVSGQTYLILIDGYSGAQGEFCLAFTRKPLVNDECVGAVDLTALTGGAIDEPQTSTIYTNTGATSIDDPNPNDVVASCWFGTPLQSNSVWFHFTGDGNTYFIETTDCSGTSEYMPDGDSQMAIFTGDCGTLTQVACNEDGPNATTTFEAAIQITTLVDTEYYVLIDGYQETQGQFCMQMTQKDPDGVNQLNAFDFEVYPNPSHDRFYIDTPETIEAATLTNLLGQQVRTYSFDASQRVELDINGISSGIYMLQLRSGNQVSTTKVVVE